MKKIDLTCPECKGSKKMLYRDEDGENIFPCDLCNGTGIFSDCDTEEKFLGRIDFNG